VVVEEFGKAFIYWIVREIRIFRLFD